MRKYMYVITRKVSLVLNIFFQISFKF